MYEKIDRIISFYKFTQIKNTERSRFDIFNYLDNLNILGTILIANEGINVNICGSKNNIDLAKKYILKLLDIKNIHINETKVNAKVFTKLKVKVKDEIIKIGFCASEQDVSKNRSLEPKEWDELLESKPLVIDMRNRFEYLMGTFKDSESLNLLNFSDLEQSLKDRMNLNKEKISLFFALVALDAKKRVWLSIALVLKRF